ncbi:VPS37B subunit of ESCRT-I a isoform X1 [Poecilia reticulata]|uniref:VPS37B subunit of ESCRT-I b n=1 Tax=Poecilia reticulata TaxID=8081 RepID=A0A3P9PK81_POERE|nr:PREDICTED: vacuolar protein sorting-associated protein 37B isoform X1 [Poecilia reticulata]
MSSFSTKFGGYTMTQLNEFLEDDEKLLKMVQEMDEVQEVQQNKEKTLANNRTLAEQNLTLQPQLEHKKEQLTKSYSCLQESFESYQFRKSKLDHKSGATSLDILLALLQAEGAKIEEETENMADSFLDGDMTLDAFVDSYQNKRKLAHLRRVKIEKLQEMVQKGQHLLPQAAAAPSSRPQDIPAVSSLLADGNGSNSSPVAQPRRKPPAPPFQPPPVLSPTPTAAPPSPFFCPPSQYPPIPPRTGQPFPSVSTGYPSPYISQYPPALPQRPPPRLAPQPGFIIQ